MVENTNKGKLLHHSFKLAAFQVNLRVKAFWAVYFDSNLQTVQ